jgi:formylglycine-generating enzyme required for sulfatase activity
LTPNGTNAQGFVEYTLDKDKSVILIQIPGGSFTISSGARVTLSPFMIAKTELTWAQYRRFCMAADHPLPPRLSTDTDESHPVVNTTWEDAAAYCKWAGLKLPSEAQWEYAARSNDGRSWPWGNQNPRETPIRANLKNAEDGFEDTAPAGSFPKGIGPFGTLDQAGNVSEWCQDGFESGLKGELTDPVTAHATQLRVIRGGSHRDEASQIKSTERGSFSATSRNRFLGFRPAN